MTLHSQVTCSTLLLRCITPTLAYALLDDYASGFQARKTEQVLYEQCSSHVHSPIPPKPLQELSPPATQVSPSKFYQLSISFLSCCNYWLSLSHRSLPSLLLTLTGSLNPDLAFGFTASCAHEELQPFRCISATAPALVCVVTVGVRPV